MKSYLSWAASETHSDDADSTVISMVFVFPILLMMIITMVEVPILFSNRNLMQNDLRQGARTAAILGGTGITGVSSANKLAYTYSDNTACNELGDIDNSWIDPSGVGHKTLTDGKNDPVACETASAIGNNKSYIAFHIYEIKCGPVKTNKIGEPTWCQASYYFDGIPGGSMSLIGGWNHFGYTHQDDIYAIQDDNFNKTSNAATTDSSGNVTNAGRYGMNSGVIRMSAQSEVCLGDDCSSR